MTSREPSSLPAVALADVADAPQWLPSPAELDDTELALAGVGLPVAVQVTAEVAQSLDGTAGLALTDPEGTPLALLRVGAATPTASGDGHVVVTGPVVPLQPAEHGPFRRLRLSATAVRAGASAAGPSVPGAPTAGSTAIVGDASAPDAVVLAGSVGPATFAAPAFDEPGPASAGSASSRLAVLVDQPLQEAHLSAIAAAADGRPIVFLVLAGHGSPQLVDAATLIRITVLAAESLTGAAVVVVPLARRTDPAEEQSRRAAVLAAYVGVMPDSPDVVTLDTVQDALPVGAVRAVLDAGQGLTPDTFAAPVEALIEQSHRRPDEQGLTVLFTGLSGSGKSTLARAFAEAVNERFGRTVTLLDGDVVRRMLSAGLTFSKPDRELNVRRIGFVAAEINRHGGLAVCCPIAPYASTRADVRAMVEAVGSFVLVHVSTPLAECERRDRKGLYAKARAGLIPEFTGISDPYEEPTDADLVIDTTGVSVAAGVEQVVDLLTKRGNLVSGVAVGRTPPDALSAGTAQG